jgi:hypothetical protein
MKHPLLDCTYTLLKIQVKSTLDCVSIVKKKHAESDQRVFSIQTST